MTTTDRPKAVPIGNESPKGRTERVLASIPRGEMHAVGAHYAEIRVDKGQIAVSTEQDLKNVIEFVEERTPLEWIDWWDEGRGHVVQFQDPEADSGSVIR